MYSEKKGSLTSIKGSHNNGEINPRWDRWYNNFEYNHVLYAETLRNGKEPAAQMFLASGRERKIKWNSFISSGNWLLY